LGTDSDLFTITLRSVLDGLGTLAAIKDLGVEVGKRAAFELKDEDGHLRQRLRIRFKFTSLHPRRKRMLERVQARTLIDAYSGRDIIKACDACKCARIEEWRVRAVFEELYEYERRLRRFA
jgi:hypothetical protein